MRRAFIFWILALLTGFMPVSASVVPSATSVQWVQKSSEYAAICHQTFRHAAKILRDKASKETGDWAVVFDLDETVLDNSEFFKQPEVAAYKGRYDDLDLWGPWVRQQRGGTVPGARAFIEMIRELGPHAHIAYISNRGERMENDTREVLRKNGLLRDGDILLLKKDSKDSKLVRRECVESGKGRCGASGPLKILALFGDQITDFVEVSNPKEMTSLRNEKIPADSDWGERFFVIPNPLYGGWEYISE